MRSRTHSLAAVSAAALGLLLGAGCADKNNPTSPPPWTGTGIGMTGAFVSGGASGPLQVGLGTNELAGALRAPGATPTVGNATARIRPNGGSWYYLSGTYDTETDSLYLSGSGYDFAGRTDTTGITPAITGSWTGPKGPGAFVCVDATSQAPVAAYCALYTSGIGPGTGNWLIVASGDQLAAVAYPDGGGDPVAMQGLVSGTGATQTITLSGSVAGTDSIAAVGTLDTTNDTVYGSYHVTDPSSTVIDAGIWQGGLCQ